MILRSVVLAAALAATVLAAPAQARADDLPIDRPDRTGDVNVFDGGGTKPTTGQRNSIDLTRFQVTRNQQYLRFTFTIARIVAGRTFDQIVEAQFVPVGRPLDELVVLANPQHKTATTFSGTKACPLEVHTSRRTGRIRVDVPGSCVPRGDGVLRVSAYLQEKNGSGPGFSEDRMRVPGRVSLR